LSVHDKQPVPNLVEQSGQLKVAGEASYESVGHSQRKVEGFSTRFAAQAQLLLGSLIESEQLVQTEALEQPSTQLLEQGLQNLLRKKKDKNNCYVFCS